MSPLMKDQLGYEGESSETNRKEKKTTREKIKFHIMLRIRSWETLQNQMRSNKEALVAKFNRKKEWTHKQKTTIEYLSKRQDYQMSRWLYPQVSSTAS